jgi:15-cis-phytoene synthase
MLVAAENGKRSGNQSMNPRNDPSLLAESRRFCRRLAKNAGSNFLWAFPSLSKPKRRAMYALYAFMRYTDDLIDSPADQNEFPAERKTSSVLDLSAKDRLKHWRSMLRLWLRSDATATDEMYALHNRKYDDAVWDEILLLPAVSETVERYQIPTDYLFSVLDGVEMDLAKNRYQTFAELEAYCERVASAVGLACIHIWGFEGRGKPEAATVLELARKVGIAYQLTNILRDIQEDAAMDRVYLPLDEIAAASYSVEELMGGVVNPAFEKLMRGQLDRAEDYYRASRELYLRLKPEGKKIFGLMTATYHAILRKIAARPAAVFAGRIRPSMFERLWLLGRWTCLPPKDLTVP